MSTEPILRLLTDEARADPARYEYLLRVTAAMPRSLGGNYPEMAAFAAKAPFSPQRLIRETKRAITHAAPGDAAALHKLLAFVELLEAKLEAEQDYDRKTKTETPD